MSSDSDKMSLLDRVRNGELPVVPDLPDSPATQPRVAEASVREKMDFSYNPDGTLSSIVWGSKVYSFVWNRNQTLSRITVKGE